MLNIRITLMSFAAILLAVAHAAGGSAVHAGAWTVDHGASHIAFAGTHAGQPFEGRFADWRADIVFAPDTLPAARADVTIATGSAATGSPLYDSTLVKQDWFDTDAHPEATVTVRDFQDTGGGAYSARATITIRGTGVTLDLPFTVAMDGDRAVMDAAVSLNRLDFAIGAGSDAAGDWVSPTIDVRLHVEAVRRAE